MAPRSPGACKPWAFATGRSRHARRGRTVGYVYIDYFDTEGEVLHLLPNRHSDVFNLKPRRDYFTLGKSAQTRACWTLSGPAGEQLVTLVAAKKVLFPTERPDVENARDYLAALSAGISGAPQGDRAAALLFFSLRQ
jgi:hypothetical protein